MRLTILGSSIVAGALAASAIAFAAQPKVAYPESYRKWDHVKTLIIGKGHPLHERFGGLNNVYANRKAIKGFAGAAFEDGSVIVLDVRELVEGADKASEAGARKLIAVMQKNSKRFAATGGWGYEAFKGDSRERTVADKAVDDCYFCHQSRKDRDFVFSAYRD
jgi:hypothetical protein